LTLLLNGIVGPLQQSAVEQINLALQHISDRDAQGRFMILLWNVCVASIVRRLERKGLNELATTFTSFALSHFDRPSGMNIKSVRDFFMATRQDIADKLGSADEETLADAGLSLLSVAFPDQQEFTKAAALSCGNAAHMCAKQAAIETDKVLGIPPEFNAATTKIDEQVYFIKYRDQYKEALGDRLTNRRIAELFLFRAWTAQFGYSVFSVNRMASEKIIGETVNACKYLGLGAFRIFHGFSIEAELGSDFISLIEDRWKEYDLLVSTMPKLDRIPTLELISSLCKRLDINDGFVTYSLSLEFLTQLDFIKRTAMELGLLTQ
jgi:hypothetical protein